MSDIVESLSSLHRIVLLTMALFLFTMPLVNGCDCHYIGGTGAERANYIKNSDFINLVVIARFINETSWAVDEDEPIDGQYQNTTFAVKEILYNRNPDSPLQNYAEIQTDGTMLVHKKTRMTCFVGPLPAQDIGLDYLLEIRKLGDSFSSCGCGSTCRYSESASDILRWELDKQELCFDTATELRSLPSSQPSENPSSQPSTADVVSSTSGKWPRMGLLSTVLVACALSID